jgi:hypothetical protein
MIVYVSYVVDVHGLAFRTEAEVEAFGEKIRRAVDDIPRPLGRDALEGDVAVSVEGFAGTPDEEDQ